MPSITPRYKKRTLTVSAALFNSFAFAVLSVLSSVQFTLAAGFGLFAILALFTLRSEQIPKVDIAYFFGAISLAVITSIKGTELAFVVLMLGLLLIAVYFFDHPKLLPTSYKVRLSLAPIPTEVLAKPEGFHKTLAKQLALDISQITKIKVMSLDFIKDELKAEVEYNINGKKDS